MRMSTIPLEALLGIGMLPISSTYQAQLKDKIDILSKKYSREEGKATGALALSAQDDIFKHIKLQVLEQIQPFYTDALRTSESWCLKYSNGQKLTKHNHIVDGALLTYSYIIDSGGSDTPLQFYDIRGEKIIKEVSAKTGMIICFSNYINHGIEIHKGNDRYILAGNLVGANASDTLLERKKFSTPSD
mgnify:CR=1 FL=1